jgi:hypothetical protein
MLVRTLKAHTIRFCEGSHQQKRDTTKLADLCPNGGMHPLR